MSNQEMESDNAAEAAMAATVADDIVPEELKGGRKLTVQEGNELKTLCWGSGMMPQGNFWLKQGITFHPAEGLFAYGLKTQSNGTKSILMCIQAYLIKHLIFESRQQKKGKPGQKAMAEDKQRQRIDSIKTSHILKPNATIQEEMLVGALSEILFKAANGKDACVCMLGPNICLAANSHNGIEIFTEKMHVFRCKKLDDVNAIIKRFYSQLVCENGTGLLCFLYSLVMSRGFKRVREDLQNEVENSLIDLRGDSTPGLQHLILFGRATPYLHNGSMEVKDETGQIGILIWSKDANATAMFNIGARLKTPILPMWLTRCNDSIGVLFNPNKDLLKTYDAEKRFSLYYYCDRTFKDKEVKKETKLTINTSEKKAESAPEFDAEDNVKEPLLESLIRTKWEGCAINWNGVEPFF